MTVLTTEAAHKELRKLNKDLQTVSVNNFLVLICPRSLQT